MGNTKYIAFQGDIYKGEESSFLEETLLEVAHGDHVAVNVLHCYLHWEGETEVENANPFVIGHLTSHSMSGFSVVDHIIKHMKDGHIIKSDVDWGDVEWINVSERKIESKSKVDFL